LDVFDDAGWTPWQHALFSGHIETAELLKLPQLEQGIFFNFFNCYYSNK